MNPHTSSISPSSNLPTIEATAPSQQTLISSLTSSTVAQAPNSGANSNVLLATAILSVKNRSGDFVPCRAILDSASQINFVTARLANMLQLPFKQSAILISGIGESNFVADKEIDVFAQSQDKGYNTSFTAVVTPSITDYRPNFSLSSEWIIPSNINLADPLFFKPQRIDLLIGAAELKALRFDKKLNSSSKLHSLNPFIDSFGLLRVGGRLQNSLLDFEAKHPPLLPKHHPVTNAIIDHFHRKYLHAGPQSVLASIRQQYWPIGGRKTVASVISKCIRCFRLKPIIYEHIMGSLPADRVQANRTFFTTGIDYCGPFYYKSEVRSRPPIKCYICVFVCFSTKACHLELTQDLSTSSFLAALKRFICTRGKPHTIWSDNATNFVGAKNELQELSQLFSSNSHNTEVTNQCNLEGISWKFIPPRSPHFGLWEAAVKSAKFHFLRTVGLSILTFEELRTLVCEIGAIVNSRPLCPISENPDDLNVLTPAHFLIGAPFTSVVEPDVTGLDISRLSRWQHVCHMQQVFWKRWSSSYLSLLQERVKWRKSTEIVQVGNMVILKEENLPPLKWRLGRVESLIRGADGVARIAIIYTANGLVKRAVGKIAVLPIETEAVGDLHLPTGGGCSQQH
ncbi:uncharacterized protein LOC128857749 [Anastrepha ludens]|uniref:uncharacterized protein LOC128857749 n=1 Tax=Anastrepha ludens TaxID=28586 RepID=UPI0023B0E8D7|nr:uncharacterized protein LOC128857749 [Anastrepha ludens]